MKQILGLLFCVILLAGCSRHANFAVDPPKDNKSIQVNDKALSLADYLRRVPGLYVRGTGSNTRVMLRENATIESQQEPLYLVDGYQIGNSYEKVERALDPNDIKEIKVLKHASETAIYGLRGQGGVILITTKKGGE